MASTNHQFRCLASLIFVVVLASAATDRLPSAPKEYTPTDKEMLVRHEQWMAQFGRVYEDAAEKKLRFKIFKQNVEYIESINRAGDRKYKLGVNKFTDLTNEEFKASHTGDLMVKPSHASKRTTTFRYENMSDVPPSMDWRTRGAVTPIKDQGSCGCCWAFAAVAAIEGKHQIATGKLISLSEQELVDCDVNGDDQGCEGGLPYNAFKFVINNGGLTSEASYPYKQIDGTCSSVSPAATISGYEDVTGNSESALLQAVANQPVAVRIAGGDPLFQNYKSGVITSECGTDLDHDVTVIGYGTDTDGTKYWLIKNSWGTSWGESGYGKVQRDVEQPEGTCGIAIHPSYPTV